MFKVVLVTEFHFGGFFFLSGDVWTLKKGRVSIDPNLRVEKIHCTDELSWARDKG